MALEFRTSLLREKFVLRDPAGDLSDTEPVIALSNRMVVPLVSKNGKKSETFIVRTQNMHSCTRFAGLIAKEFFDRGSIAARNHSFRWQDMWHDIIKGYEKDWNENIWGCVYHNGKIIFDHGDRHPFLDIIEQCDAKNEGEYEKSVAFAEDAFRQAGKIVKIEHDANIALVVSVTEELAKCGVIVRGANKTTTFNYNVKPKNKTSAKVSLATILTTSAAFLEGIQLSFFVGMWNKKKAYSLFEKYSDEDRKGDRATTRLANLNRAISQFEQTMDVNFRPDKPNFSKMVHEAEEFSMTILKPQIEEMIRKGELNQDEWIT